ncbi:SDR family oxidoreductase [Sinomonas terrae]|uniref:SDR family oxidoreductase n=1 Tax=Sinomonas terrae TaxID=2908838 RepID=UPI0027E0CB29|nr:SDR family oxidoreductase [Sinomonas terrae]
MQGRCDPNEGIEPTRTHLVKNKDERTHATHISRHRRRLRHRKGNQGATGTTRATGTLIYASTKLGLSRWVRREAANQRWAGSGIPLNAVAPGIIATPMTADLISTEQGREVLLQNVPMPLNGIADPIVVARLLAWLGSEENTHVCGQIIYVDGGSDVVLRGDAVW